VTVIIKRVEALKSCIEKLLQRFYKNFCEVQQKLDCTFSSKPNENLRFHDELSLARILSHLIS
jgi:hypothetical protein